MSESIGLFLLTQMVFLLLRMVVMPVKLLDVLYAEHRELFGNRQEPVFPLLTKILDANELA